MRICLVGHHESFPEEGTRNLTLNIANQLSVHHTLQTIQIKRISEWRKLKSWQPEIINFIIGGTSISAFFTTWIISRFSPNSRTVISVVQPSYSNSLKWASLFKPDLVLVQSLASGRFFERLGWHTEILPGGVDTKRFVPVSKHRKYQIRSKYELNQDKYVVLHVGSIKRGRNVGKLIPLQSSACQVLIVGRSSESHDEVLIRELRAAGCLVLNKYIAQVEEVYALADCYVFPVVYRANSIELPLSVLEAMACDLPIVSTSFCALPDYFKGVPGFNFVNSHLEITETVSRLIVDPSDVATRLHVMDFSWEKVVEKLETIYETLLS